MMTNETDTATPADATRQPDAAGHGAPWLARFSDDRSGSVAITFALTSMVVFGIIGGAIDLGRSYAARGQNEQALDSAVLAAGRVLQIQGSDTAQAITTAERFYVEHKSQFTTSDLTSFAVVDNGTAIRATSDAKIATPFLSILGINEIDVKTQVKAVLAAGGNAGTHIEVAMMLDITGSMGGTKIADLKLAAKDLIDIVVWADQSEYTSRVALAPFSEHVNVGRDYFRAVTNRTPSGSGDSRTCVRERSTSDRYTDAPPASGNYFNAYTSSSTCRPSQPIMPLTSDKSALKSRIDDFSATGNTAGHLGTQWAWYMLSPRWNGIWPTSSEARAYSDITAKGEHGQPLLQKIAVLMTDGEYNTQYSGSASYIQARTICQNMKSEGIIVYTVGFQIAPGGTADTTMRDCATDSTYYYSAGDGDALRGAFRDIALKIATLRLAE
ncbi:MAG: pilus assembly protein [Hyphomicrobiaceae bacterium]